MRVFRGEGSGRERTFWVSWLALEKRGFGLYASPWERKIPVLMTHLGREKERGETEGREKVTESLPLRPFACPLFRVCGQPQHHTMGCCVLSPDRALWGPGPR